MDEQTPFNPDSDKEVIDETSNPSRLPLFLVIAAAIGGLLLVCLFGYLLVCGEEGCFGGDGPEILSGDPTPTPFAPPVPTAAPQDSVVSVDVGGSETISLTIDAPIALNVGGRRYTVSGQQVGVDNRWNPTFVNESATAWLNGTIINYVVAMQDTEANRGLMQSLERGSEMLLETTSGEVRKFAFDQRNQFNVNNRDVYGQTQPGITILLVGLGEASQERIVVQGRYIVEQTAAPVSPEGSANNVVELGEVAQLGDAQISVSLLDNRPQQTEGFAYFLVDFQLQNTGAAALDTTLISFNLIDDVGNQYAQNPQASLVGNNPPLGPSVPAGQIVNATAGYQIPVGINESSLAWVVNRVDTGERVEVRVSRDQQLGSSVQAAARIDPPSVKLTQDGANVILNGQISNDGTDILVVNEGDVSLRSGAGTVYFIASTNPAWPWIIDPGQTIPYTIAVQRPLESTAVFSILNSSFELTGFR